MKLIDPHGEMCGPLVTSPDRGPVRAEVPLELLAF